MIKVTAVTHQDNETVFTDSFIPVNKIVAINARYKVTESKAIEIIGSFIQLDDGNGLYVCCKETPEEIMELIEPN